LAEREHGAEIRKLHHNAQRLLRPIKVVNPYAEGLTFLDDKTRTRRDHRKYLALIRAIALLHQHQRPIRRLERPGAEPLDYIEASLDDIAAANTLAHAVLGTTLDELPPQTRRLLHLVRGHVGARGYIPAICALRGARSGKRQAGVTPSSSFTSAAWRALNICWCAGMARALSMSCCGRAKGMVRPRPGLPNPS